MIVNPCPNIDALLTFKASLKHFSQAELFDLCDALRQPWALRNWDAKTHMHILIINELSYRVFAG